MSEEEIRPHVNDPRPWQLLAARGKARRAAPLGTFDDDPPPSNLTRGQLYALIAKYGVRIRALEKDQRERTDTYRRLRTALLDYASACDECEDGAVVIEMEPSVYCADGSPIAHTEEFDCPSCGWVRKLLREFK